MNKIQGVFLTDTHLPDSINLKPVFKYIEDLYKITRENKDKFYLILGGDIIDSKGMFGIESLAASQIKLDWYERDKQLLRIFLLSIRNVCKPDKIIFLAGNHEHRYVKIMARYPDAFGKRFNFDRDVLQEVFPGAKWIPYSTYDSFYKLGDCVFKHGTIYPENHAKKYVTIGLPYKTVYGHLHSYQAFTYHSEMPTMAPRYAVVGGGLCKRSPEWKKGAPNMWVNGFVSFTADKGITIPTVHLIEKGKFHIGGVEYR